MSQVFKIWKKGLNISFGVERSYFLLSGRERERERKEKRKNKNFSLQSTEFCWSEFVGLRMKVHLLDDGYAWVPKTRDFS